MPATYSKKHSPHMALILAGACLLVLATLLFCLIVASSVTEHQSATTEVTLSSAQAEPNQPQDKDPVLALPIAAAGAPFFVLGLALAIFAAGSGAHLLKEERAASASPIIAIVLISSSFVATGSASAILASQNATLAMPTSYTLHVDPRVSTDKADDGAVATFSTCMIRVTGSTKGFLSVSASPTTLTASDGSTVQLEPSSGNKPLTFTSEEIAEGTVKADVFQVSGDVAGDGPWSATLTYIAEETCDGSLPADSFEPTLPAGIDGWYTPDEGQTYYYVSNGKTVRGWLETEASPSGDQGEVRRYWLTPETGILARSKAVKTSISTYAYAKNDGEILRGSYSDSDGHFYLADEDGRLAWGTQTGWVLADYGYGTQRYYIEAGRHSAKVGFFDIAGQGSFYGTTDGFVVCGKTMVDNHIVLAGEDGKLVEADGWLDTDEFDGEQQQRYRFECLHIDGFGTKFYGAITGPFEIEDALYYGKLDQGFIVRDEAVEIDGKKYGANAEGKLTDLSDWQMEEADWGTDNDYVESCRKRAIANASETSTDYYITVDNREEGGGRAIIFKKESDTWVALAGWYANVGRWTGSGDEVGTRSIPGIYQVTHKLPALYRDDVSPYWTCYFDCKGGGDVGTYWTDYYDGYEDGQGFHGTADEIPGNTMAGCCALTDTRAKWIYDNIPIGTAVDVFGAAHGVNYD